MKTPVDNGIYTSEKKVYEVAGIREQVDWTGEEWAGEVIECADDEQAIALAKTFGERWRSRIKLYSVPFVNTTQTHSCDLWPDQYKLVADIPKPNLEDTQA